MRLEALSKRLGGNVVLGPLDLTFPPGITGIVGVNGAGKTTLLRILARQLKPTSGKVVNRAGETFGYMPQALDFPRGMRVEEFLYYSCWLQGIAPRLRRDAVDNVLEKLDLTKNCNSYVRSLSGGFQRRVLFAQAILRTPDTLIMDEPTTGLDPEFRVDLRQRIGESREGITIVSSHILEDISGVADHVVVLDQGLVAFSDTMEAFNDVVRHAPSIDGMTAVEAAFTYLRSTVIRRNT